MKNCLKCINLRTGIMMMPYKLTLKVLLYYEKKRTKNFIIYVSSNHMCLITVHLHENIVSSFILRKVENEKN